MIGRTNTGSGGKCLAMIRVLYKAGTTATCTNGQFTFLSDQSGDFLFALPAAGTWTVTATSANDVVQTISVVMARGEAKLLTIDTLIPPAFRAAYQEVEYLAFVDRGRGNLPTISRLAVGTNEFELEKFSVNPASELHGGNVILSIYAANIYGRTDGYFFSHVTFGSDWATHVPVRINAEMNLKIQMYTTGQDNTSYRKLLVDNVVAAENEGRSFAPAQSGIISIGAAGGSENDSGRKFSGFKIRIEDELVFHGVPCIRRSDNMPGLFDLVNKDLLETPFYQGQKGTSTDVTQVLTAITAGPAIGT